MKFDFYPNCTTVESASKLSALAQPFGVGDAIKSWFGLFNLFLEANQIVITENLHALNFSDIATSRFTSMSITAYYIVAFNYFGFWYRDE